ncbi:MAG: DUF371 domain-containing protein [Thermoproteota archaeon]
MDLLLLEEIYAFGHENIKATHHSTLEVTTENYLTKKGDCIIGIRANKSAFLLNSKTKEFLRCNFSTLKVVIEVGEQSDAFICYGSNRLSFLNKTSIVFRKSKYIDDRTVGILCNKAASDIDRRIVAKLKDPSCKLVLKIFKT